MVSMEPRHYCRGNKERTVEFNGIMQVSMEPRHYCRGNLSDANSDEVRFRVSMEPRHYCRGNLGKCVSSVSGSGYVSMEPRHYCRGNLQYILQKQFQTICFNGATTLLSW